MDGNLNLEIWLNLTTWWVELLHFALISFSIGNLKSEILSGFCTVTGFVSCLCLVSAHGLVNCCLGHVLPQSLLLVSFLRHPLVSLVCLIVLTCSSCVFPLFIVILTPLCLLVRGHFHPLCHCLCSCLWMWLYMFLCLPVWLVLCPCFVQSLLFHVLVLLLRLVICLFLLLFYL